MLLIEMSSQERIANWKLTNANFKFDMANGQFAMMTARSIAQHRWHQVGLVVVTGRVGERLITRQTGADLVVGEDVVQLDRVCHRLDIVSVDFGELVDIGDDLGKLVGQRGEFVLAQLQAG